MLCIPTGRSHTHGSIFHLLPVSSLAATAASSNNSSNSNNNSIMEQEVARWLFSQLGYNASGDATLSSNCRGNLKGLWEFVMANYKTAESKRHIQHMLAKHKREQEAARRAPEQQKEAAARLQRLYQLRKKNAELEQTLCALQARTESRAQEATDQVCEQSLMQHVLQETQAQALLLQACVHRGQQLLPELQATLAQLRYTLDTVKARCRHTGSGKVQASVQQQLAALSSSIKDGLNQTMWDTVHQQGIPMAGSDLQHPADQQPLALPATGSVSSLSGSSAQQDQQQGGGSTVEGLQQLLQLCKLLQGYRVPADVLTSALLLLQHPPSLLWDACTQLAHQNLLELTAHLDEAEREMLAPLHWPGRGMSASQQHSSRPDQQPQQQLVPHSDCCGSSKHRLPWASGMSLPSAAALQELGISPPPEVRIKLRLKDHIQLHIQTEQTLQRVQATQRELDTLLGSTPLLQAALTAGGEDGSTGSSSSISWEAELALVYLDLARARAQVQLLQQYEQRFEHELLQLKEIKGITEDKKQDVQQQMGQDHELNMLLHLAAADTMELEASLRGHQQRVAQLLSLQLLPCGMAAADASLAAVGQQQHEVAAVMKLPLLDLTEPMSILTPQAKPGAHSGSSQSHPVLSRTTLARLHSASKQLLIAGRVTTGAKAFRGAAATHAGAGAGAALAGHDVLAAAGSSDRRFGDGAAVAALKGAALLDPAAPLRCPAALLLDVAGRCLEARQVQQQLEGLLSTSAEVAATINAAVAREEQLQEKVDLLHLHQRQEVLPKLQALLEEGQAARAFARDELMTDLKHLWEMPAMHLVPHHKYQGKDCTNWLLELQHLHAQKNDLSGGGAAHAHMA